MNAQNALMELPRCPVCGEQMIYHPPGTPEQDFCGAWYVCQCSGHYCATLIPSRELAEMYAKAGKPIYHPSLSPGSTK